MSSKPMPSKPMPSNDLVVITGSSGGLGLSVTRFLLASGWRNLICHYRSHRVEIEQLLKEFDLDPSHRLVQADLLIESDLNSLRESVASEFGPVFGLVNLIGASSNKISWKMNRNEFSRVVDANLTSTFLACQQFIPEMRKQQKGRIINVSSVVAFTGVAGASHYCAAKAGVIGLSKALAVELAPNNIAVSVVALGYMDFGLIRDVPADMQTDLKSKIAGKRFGTGEEAGALFEFLLGKGGAYSGGQVYHLNGGIYS